ncbi:ATP-binding protein [Tundrisphaera sp. TA3]|uniref:ATP-binding protein n=1 Tax=Tundrisphaera sp. TA3 TaxID=3435775 RepID=UPI003EBB42A3
MRLSQDVAGHSVDVTNCDKEPIHIPGRIQSHGVLFALSKPGLLIEQISDNAEEVVGHRPADLLGKPLSILVDPARWDGFRETLLSPDARAGNPLRFTFGSGEQARTFDGSAHRNVDGVLILEIENGRLKADRASGDHSQSIRRAMSRLQGTSTLRDFCQVAASELRSLAGFDRVTVYRFDPAWNGHVFAEDKRDGLEPLLGLHFPASDIPEQARRLYHLNPIRLIADVASTPSELIPANNPGNGRPLDLSLSVLRSVSPIHIKYLENMGAGASMSISLTREGRLWGLLSCMHYRGGRYVPPEVRATCEFLGVLTSVQLGVKEDSEDIGHRSRLQAIRESLMQRMSEASDLVEGLTTPGSALLELTAATGAAIVHGSHVATLGETPDEDQILDLVRWLRVHASSDVFFTDSLPRIYPDAAEFRDKACGLVSIATSKSQGHHVLWFRPEVIQTVDWGGNPNKPVEAARDGVPLSPRTSFELWKEVVRLKSLPWQACEIDVARGLRDAIIAVVVRRAEELTRLNEELERSNTDLDAFAYIASHDLKEPLRGIHNYASFLLEDYADRLEEDGVSKLNTMVRLTQRMEDLIESLLRYSQLGRVGLSFSPVDLHEVVTEVLDNLALTLSESGAEVRIPRRLPVAMCDRVQVGEIFSNLIANALKYTDKVDRWVEVGYEEPIRPIVEPSPGAEPASMVLYVRDNGIGIAERYQATIFRLFKRLHARDKFGGGTGAGLTIAKKIVERHGGTIWVESAPGKGTTFYFTLRG